MLKFIENKYLNFFLPAIEFINYNFNYIDKYTLVTLGYFIVVIFFIFCCLAIILSKFLKVEFINILLSLSLINFFIFNYQNFKNFILSIFKIQSFEFLGEISVFIIIILSFLTFFLFFKKKENWINFVKIFILMIIFFNSYDLLKLYNKNFVKNEKHETFSNIKYLSDNNLKDANKSKKRNIYYFLVDAAIPLETFNNNFSKIPIKKIKEKYSSNNFHYIEGTKSNYTGTGLAISQMFNLEYYINENSPKFNQTHVFPSIMSNFNKSPLKIILDKVDYKFFWYGNVIANCKMYNLTMCPKRSKDNKMNFEISTYVKNITTKLSTNYVLRNYLQKTPLIDLNNKLFDLEKKKSNFLRTAHFENDGIHKFILFDKFNKSYENRFTFVHAIMPHGFADSENYPLVYNPDCSMKKVSAQELQKIKIEQMRPGGEHIGYSSNYLCMLKRIDELIEYLNKNDPDSIVIIQSDHGILRKGIVINENFTLVKAGSKCKKYLNEKLNNINAMRLAVSCATNQQVNLLEHKSFDEKKNLPMTHPDRNKVFLIN